MQTSTLDRERLRRLAELRHERPVVLSLYIDLDPREFATPPARATAARSLLDEAERKLKNGDGLSHQDRVDLEATLERVRRFMQRDLPTDGARAVAVFASEPAGLFETLKLPRSVRSRVQIGRSPLVGPLAAVERRERWCVALVNRADARFLRGGPDGLRELPIVHDDVHGQHDQGGWSQARYQRSVDKEAADHFKRAADELFGHFRRRPFEHLLLGGPESAVAEFEGKLHGWLGERLAGRVEVDVGNSTPEQVLKAARECFDEVEERREEEALARLDEGSRGVADLANVLRPLNERRVEALLLDETFSAPGALCPECGWLGAGGERECPADGTQLEQVDDVTEHATELALQQDAAVTPFRHRVGELRERGGVAALLRF